MNNNNDNVKIINLNIENTNTNTNTNNNNNNNNNSINEIIFNDNDNNNKENLQNFFLNNENIIIEENVALENKEKQYKNDIIYIQELENQLLSTYPVTKQNSKYIQQLIEHNVSRLIELKNRSIVKFNMYKEDIHYPLVNDIINNKYDNKFIIPIVIDTHKIFTNINVESSENNFNIINNDKKIENVSFGLSYENPSGYKEESQIKLVKELNENRYEFEQKKKDFQTFLDTQSNLYISYQIKYNLNNNINQNGLIIKTLNNNLVLRYYDLFDTEWNTHNNNDDLTTPVNIYDEDGKIKKVVHETLVKGQNMNIVGFMLLHNGGSNILDDYKDIYAPKNYSNHLHKILYGNIEISNINQKQKDEIILTVKTHNLKDNDVIYIDNTNCFPSINNFYGNKLKFNIIDNDTITINTGFKLQLNGNYGNIYKISKLKYDLYNVSNDTDIEFLKTNYEDENQNIKHNKIFLFKNIQLDKTKYDTIVKKILPSLDEIIEIEYDSLKKASSFEEINNILKKYNITIDDLCIEQGKYIKKIFNTNIKNIKSTFNKKIVNNIKNYHISDIAFLKEDNNYLLNNKNIESSYISNYYGSYPYINKNFDCIMTRYNWIWNKNDYGDLYYLHTVLNNNYDKLLPYLKDKIIYYKKNIDLVEADFLKIKDIEGKISKCKFYKYEALIITEKDVSNKYENVNIDKNIQCHVFLNNELYELFNYKLTKIENIDDKTKLLIGHELWKYNSTKDSWIYDNEYSHYNKIKYVCEFNNIDIENINLDNLDCIYKKEYGCGSKTYSRFLSKIEDLKKIHSQFIELEKSIKNKEKQKEIEGKMKVIIEKFYYENILKKDNNKNTKNSQIKKMKTLKENIPPKPILNTVLQKLVYSIYKLRNPDLIQDCFYEIIDKDCLLVGLDLYSKKYNEKYDFCGHYYYLKKISYSNNPDERIKYITLLLSKYSDDGEAEKNNLLCKNCGQYLMNNAYDETEGFASSGALIKPREDWTENDWKIFNEQESKLYLSDIISSTQILDCNDDKFKKILLNEGLDANNIDEALEICTFITKNLYHKLGIILQNGDLIKTIIESMQQIINIYPYNIYKSLEIRKLKEKMSDARIQQMDEKGIFKTGYIKIREIRRQCIICARLLITIQTIIPNLLFQKRTSSCQFSGFDGVNGIDFMACILQELNNDSPKESPALLEFYKASVNDYYTKYKNTTYILELFKEKYKYLLTIRKEKETIHNIEDEYRHIFEKEPEKIENNIHEKILKIKTYKELVFYKSQLLNRNLFLIQNIKDIIADVIAKSPLSDKYVGQVETSCCSEEATEYIGFYQYIQLENDKIETYMNETNKIYKLLTYFYNSGCYHRFYLYNKDKFAGCYNTIIVYDGKTASEKFIKSVFMTYVNTGIYTGTLRDFVDNTENAIDIKTGMTKKEIKNHTYSSEELNKLLKEIEMKNIHYYKPHQVFKIDNATLQTLKKNSLEHIDIQINILMNNISILLNKGKDFSLKYNNIIKNFGIYDINDKLEKITAKKDKIILRNHLYNKKLDFFKKFYISVFKKYLSMIKNNFDVKEKDIKLQFIEDTDVKKEMQQYIGLSRENIDFFMEPNVSDNFNDCIANYSNEEINSIIGVQEIYNMNYTEIKKYSDFNNNDASNVILFILIHNLNQLFIYKNNTEGTVSYDLNLNENKNFFIAKFVLLLLEEIEENYELFELCNKNNEIENEILYDYIQFKLKMLGSGQGYDTVEKPNSIYKNEAAEHDDKERELEYKLEHLNNTAIDTYKNKYGKEPTQGQLDNIKQNVKEQIADEDYYDETNMDAQLHSNEIMDQGGEYGELNENDFEASDGFIYEQEE